MEIFMDNEPVEKSANNLAEDFQRNYGRDVLNGVNNPNRSHEDTEEIEALIIDIAKKHLGLKED